MNRHVMATLLIGAQLLGGCAEMTHLTRTRQLGSSQFLLIDAKQRAISSVNNINCAEPSPDALSALAASQNLNLATPQGTSIGQSFAIAESAGSIGLRTQSIQLLRDHMFRVCEAYQAGKISPFMVALFHRRFQTSTIAILAIEQLTGTMRAPAIVLGGSSTSGNADAVLKLTATRETVQASIGVAEKDFATKSAAATTADDDVTAKSTALTAATTGGDAAAITAAKAALATATTNAQTANAAKLEADSVLAGRKAALAAIDRSLTLAQASGSASSNGVIEATSSHNPGDVEAVAKAVVEIVKGTYELGNTKDFCTVLLADAAQKASTVDPTGPIVKSCLNFLGTGQMLNGQ
jgi:hypothetical protein